MESRLGIVPANALHVCVGNDGSGMIPDHAPGLLPLKLPYRKNAERALLLGCNQRLDQVVGALLGFDDGHERLFGAIDIPQRQRRYKSETLGKVHLVVWSAIFSVHTHACAWRHQSVI